MIDQKPRIATEQDVHAPWSGGRDGKYFRCKLCGYKFKVGDYYRFIYHKYGNIIVCQSCDSDGPEQKWTQMHEEWQKLREGKFWWFMLRLEDELRELERDAARESRFSADEIEFWKNRALCEKER